MSFRPTEEWDGIFYVQIAGQNQVWSVDMIEREEGGKLVLSGLTDTKELWDDCFWFELVAKPLPARITYWGDRVIWRTDGP